LEVVGQDVHSRQEALGNFIGQDSVAFDRASLDNEIHKLWDLESIKRKRDRIFRGEVFSQAPWKQGHNPFPVISKSISIFV